MVKLVVHGSILLKLVSDKWGMNIWTVFNCGSSDRRVGTRCSGHGIREDRGLLMDRLCVAELDTFWKLSDKFDCGLFSYFTRVVK
jgi:hypothetical protein